MALLNLANWPLLVICAAMIVAAVIDGWKLKVPNWLTFPLVLSGWLLGLCTTSACSKATRRRRHRRQPGWHRVWASLLLLPVYAIGGMGGRRRQDADGLRRLGRGLLRRSRTRSWRSSSMPSAWRPSSAASSPWA